jgi:metallo-beta-lactamase family protein
VNCQIRTFHGLSAHADGDELLRFLGPTLKPETTAYVVHGEVPQAETFAGRLLKAGVGRAMVPAMESSMVTGDAPAVMVGVEKGMGRSGDTQE